MTRLRIFASMCCFAACGWSATLAADEYGSIKGQVTRPNDKGPAEVNVTVDQAHCLQNGPLKSNAIEVNPKNKGLKSVIVYLRPDSDDRKAKFPQEKIKPELKNAPPTHHVVDQPCCQFIPRVVAARDGDTMEVKNSAPVAHNVNYSGPEAFNEVLQPGETKKFSKPLTASASMIPFSCNIHPWMQGRILVFDHPYFAVTDDDGKFEIKNVPVGKWRIVYRHENGYHKGRDGITGDPITVTGPSTEAPTIEFKMP